MGVLATAFFRAMGSKNATPQDFMMGDLTATEDEQPDKFPDLLASMLGAVPQKVP
jgi:hypothetical protein